MACTTGMKEPNTTVVMMTSASVVVTITPRSLNSLFELAEVGIYSTSPKAMAPRIIPPYEMNANSRSDTSFFFMQQEKMPWAVKTAETRPTITIAVIQRMKLRDQ